MASRANPGSRGTTQTGYGKHADRRTKRGRTRGSQVRQAVSEYDESEMECGGAVVNGQEAGLVLVQIALNAGIAEVVEDCCAEGSEAKENAMEDWAAELRKYLDDPLSVIMAARDAGQPDALEQSLPLLRLVECDPDVGDEGEWRQGMDELALAYWRPRAYGPYEQRLDSLYEEARAVRRGAQVAFARECAAALARSQGATAEDAESQAAQVPEQDLSLVWVAR